MALTGFVDDRVPRDARVARSPARRLLVGLSALVTILLGLAPVVATAQPNASIAANRTSGLAPLAVRFDATGSDCNGNGSGGEWGGDLEQCLYSWDFGDPTAPPYEYGAAAQAGQPRSANTARGFVAGHVFENPGTYTVTLTIRNPSGQTATRTQVVTVDSYTGSTQCIRATSSGDFVGCPSGATQVTQSSWNSALSSCTSSGARRCLFRRGDTFSRSGEVGVPNGPGIVGAYGSGARPIVSGSGQGLTNGSDWRVLDHDFVGVSMAGASHRLLLRTRVRNVTGSTASILWWGSGLANFYIVRSQIEDGSGYGVYLTGENFVLLGSSIARNGSTSGSSCNHNFRSGDQNRSVWASNTIGPAAGCGAVARLTGENGGSSRWSVSDNYFLVSIYGGVQIGEQYDGAITGGEDGQVTLGAFEGNYLVASRTASLDDWMVIRGTRGLDSLAFRNNIFDLTGYFSSAIAIQIGGGNSPVQRNVSIMNNTAVWRTGTNSEGYAAFRADSGLSNVKMVNNLLYHGATFAGQTTSCGGSSCSANSNNTKTSTTPFVNVSAGNAWGFRLQSGSAPVNAGATSPEVIGDFSGVVRTGARDLGAWELGGAAPPPPPVLLP